MIQVLPNDMIGPNRVVASVPVNDDGVWLVLLLHREAPYFEVAEYDKPNKRKVTITREMNIVPAVEAYQDNGGDY